MRRLETYKRLLVFGYRTDETIGPLPNDNRGKISVTYSCERGGPFSAPWTAACPPAARRGAAFQSGLGTTLTTHPTVVLVGHQRDGPVPTDRVLGDHTPYQIGHTTYWVK